MKNKTYTMFSGICLVTALMMSHSTDVQANNGYAGGSGTETDPYLISTPEQLNQLQIDVDVNRIDTTGIYYQLTNDIDLSAFDSDTNLDNGNWTPIGSQISFKGNFDGKGFDIKNLNVNLPSSDEVGFFGKTESAEITNISLVNAQVSGHENVGALVGVASDNSVIRNSSVTADVIGDSLVGGLIGKLNDNGVIEDSSIKGTVQAVGNYVGGMVGHAHLWSSIISSYSENKVVSLGDYVGGLAGKTIAPLIKDCYSVSEVEGNSSVGGLVGRFDSLTKMENSYYEGTVVAHGDFAGGLVGFQTATSNVINSHASGTVSGIDFVGGVVGSIYGASNIKNSSADIVINASGSYVGGLAGTLTNSSSIKNSFVRGEINSVGDEIGGITGYHTLGSTISKCYSEMVINATGTNVGGLVGTTGRGSTIEYSYSASWLNTSGLNVGGLIANLENPQPTIDSYWDTERAGTTESMGGTGLTTKEMSLGYAKKNMIGFDFENEWDLTNGTPKLKWENVGFVNQAPVVEAEDIKVVVNRPFDTLAHATVTDDYEDDIQLELVGQDVDTGVLGEQVITYRAADSFDAERTHTITVTVVENSAPVIHAEDITLTVGDTFIALDYATVTDDHDKDLVVEVAKDDVDTTQPGTYQIIYRAIDSFGDETIKEIKVTVKEKVVVGENKPEVKPEISPEEEITELITPEPDSEKEEKPERLPETGIHSIGFFVLGAGLVIIGIQSYKKIRNKN